MISADDTRVISNSSRPRTTGTYRFKPPVQQNVKKIASQSPIKVLVVNNTESIGMISAASHKYSNNKFKNSKGSFGQFWQSSIRSIRENSEELHDHSRIKTGSKYQKRNKSSRVSYGSMSLL